MRTSQNKIIHFVFILALYNLNSSCAKINYDQKRYDNITEIEEIDIKSNFWSMANNKKKVRTYIFVSPIELPGGYFQGFTASNDRKTGSNDHCDRDYFLPIFVKFDKTSQGSAFNKKMLSDNFYIVEVYAVPTDEEVDLNINGYNFDHYPVLLVKELKEVFDRSCVLRGSTLLSR